MPFIGTQPQVGAYSKLDAITTSATATYNLTLNSGAYYPSSANHLMVSLNGVMQAPQDSFTISGATIIFASTLASTDSIDFIMALGDVLDIGTPSDGTVVTAKIQNAAVTTAKLASTLDLSGKTVTYGLASSDLPSGSVLQVVTSLFNTNTASSSSSYVTSGHSVTITPKSSSSKIALSLIGGEANQSTGRYLLVTFYKGSSILNSAFRSKHGSGADNLTHGHAMYGEDVHGVTSAITYTVYFLGSGGNCQYSAGDAKVELTAMEIAQ